MSFRITSAFAVISMVVAGCGLPRKGSRPTGLSKGQAAQQVRFSQDSDNEPAQSTPVPNSEAFSESLETEQTEAAASGSLDQLVSEALAANPRLRRLEQETAAAWSRVGQVEALPDPVIAANVFGNPIETAAGSQRANLSVAQMIPWLKRLEAQGQQAAFEALIAEQFARAEELRIAAEVKAGYYAIYVLDRQLEINQSNRKVLESLVKTATSLVPVGKANESDVHFGALELARLEEARLNFERDREIRTAELNRLLNRPAGTPIDVPNEIDVRIPQGLEFEPLRSTVFEHQPELIAAQLQTQATAWGITVAQLKQRPDVTVNLNWFMIDDNRPASRIVDVGEDAWSLGAQVTVPLWQKKYESTRAEAAHRHVAAYAAVEDVQLKYTARLKSILEQIHTADETAQLYHKTIVPQAKQALAASLKVYGQPAGVTFERVIDDFRRVLELESRYHEAIGRLGTALARLEQVVGQ